MNDRPSPKDFITAVITVSTVFLALTPVFLLLAIQQMNPVVLLFPLTAFRAILIFSFAAGLITIGLAFEWFDKQTDRLKSLTKWTLVCQTVTFAFASFTLLALTLVYN